MKKLIALSSLILALTACSSNEKAADESAEMAKKETMAPKADAKKADAKDAKAMEAIKVACTLEKDTRIIEVKKTDGGGCELFYTKFGEEKSVASSGFGTQYCAEVKDRIQSNLSKAGFTCQ